MKPRTPEAARLEADYLVRVRQALGSRPDAAEIVQSVVEHVEEAVAEFKGLEVTLVQMAQVVERLGPPEAFAEGAEAPPREGTSGGGQTPELRQRSVMLLDRIWVACLVSTVGLFIPVIDLYLCTLVGNGMLAHALRRREGLPDEFQTLGRLCKIVVIVGLIHVPLAVLALAQPLAGFLVLPTGIALMVVPLMVYWKLMGGISSMLSTARQERLASATLDTRRVCITIEIVLMVITVAVGTIIALADGRTSGRARMEQELTGAAVGLLTLPVHWILSYFFLLRPISRARKALAEPSIVVETGLAQQH